MTDTMTEAPVPMAQWGKDHWSTFAYIETRCVDFDGVPCRDHMRCDLDRHPSLRHRGTSENKYPTRLKGGQERQDHDDWDCIDVVVRRGVRGTAGRSGPTARRPASTATA